MTDIYDVLRDDGDATAFCEQYWEITDPTIYSLGKLSMFFKDEETKRNIEVAVKAEMLSVSLIQFLSNSIDKSLNGPMKNLMFYMHQTCLHRIRLLLDRLPKAAKENSWAKKLEQTYFKKISR